MRIDNGANGIESHVPAQATKSSARVNGQAAGGMRSGSLTSVNLNSIDTLLETVASSDAIRKSVVSDIKIKLQTGEYLAKQSALETAGAILNL